MSRRDRFSERRDAGLAASRYFNRRLARRHYENFVVAGVLLPRPMRQPFYDVYAFCRTADDAADESPEPAVAGRRLGELRQRLEATFDGHPPADTFWPALADTIDRFGLLRQPFDDLLDAFEQDQTKTRYANDADLREYCRRSADPVGRIVLRMAGVTDDESVALSDRICTGLQLINFWQDVARDRRIGRVYLPQDRLAAAGVDDAALDGETTPPELRRLIGEMVDEADEHFDASEALSRRVPRWLSRSVRLFAAGGHATAEAIRQVDHDVLRVRPVVSKRTQAWLTLRHAFRP